MTTTNYAGRRRHRRRRRRWLRRKRRQRQRSLPYISSYKRTHARARARTRTQPYPTNDAIREGPKSQCAVVSSSGPAGARRVFFHRGPETRAVSDKQLRTYVLEYVRIAIRVLQHDTCTCTLRIAIRTSTRVRTYVHVRVRTTMVLK
jgi:hypothetical protein